MHKTQNISSAIRIKQVSPRQRDVNMVRVKLSEHGRKQGPFIVWHVEHKAVASRLLHWSLSRVKVLPIQNFPGEQVLVKSHTQNIEAWPSSFFNPQMFTWSLSASIISAVQNKLYPTKWWVDWSLETSMITQPRIHTVCRWQHCSDTFVWVIDAPPTLPPGQPYMCL